MGDKFTYAGFILGAFLVGFWVISLLMSGNASLSNIPAVPFIHLPQKFSTREKVIGLIPSATVSGSIAARINLDTIDLQPGTSVDFMIDSQAINSDDHAPFYLGGSSHGAAVGYNTGVLTNGAHTLVVSYTLANNPKSPKTQRIPFYTANTTIGTHGVVQGVVAKATYSGDMAIRFFLKPPYLTQMKSALGVRFLIDGKKVTTDLSTPYTFSSDTETLVNGEHTLSFEYTLMNGSVVKDDVLIVVANPREVPPSPPPKR